MKLTESHKDILKLGLLGGLFFIPFLGGVHLFDWDEINFAEVSREMMELGEYLQIHINYLPFWEKPPFFFWLQVAAMKVFGVGEFAARLPNAICGILSLIVLYLMGRQLYNRRFGLLWALVYLGSTLPHLYFRSGIIDPWFNLFIFGGLYLFLLFYWKKEQFEGIQLSRGSWTYLFAAGFVLGMGMLTKGPVAYLIVALCLFVYWIKERLRLYISPLQFLFFTLSASLVTLSWYGLETLRHGPSFIYEFNLYQYRLFSTPDAGHKGFFGYHFVVLLIGCFPASVFALRSMYAMPEASHRFQQNFRQWMLILFWVVLLLFSVVQSKIVHYSSLCYFPLTY
ncbi:MAG: glycosyltransferase family 39 protein, partial [Bacteroidota bacterium]